MHIVIVHLHLFCTSSYRSPGKPDFVEYQQFSDDVESIFTTKNLEKAPLLDVEQFQPPEEWQQNQLEPDMEDMVTKCMERLAEQVRTGSIQVTTSYILV